MCNAATPLRLLPSLVGVTDGGGGGGGTVNDHQCYKNDDEITKQCSRQSLLSSSASGRARHRLHRRHRNQHYRRRRRHRRLSHGITTLMYAAQQGFVHSIETIIKTQSHSLFDQDRTGKTALHYCCTSGSICAAQAADLIKMAAPELVDTRDEDGFTPLHLAVIAGNTQLVTFLLANGADVTAVDNEQHTVVHWATVCGETTALRAVLAAGSPVSTPDVHGGYPLHYAAQMCGGAKESEKGLQILHTLLAQRDINVACEDGEQRQPLLWAASAGSAKAVLALIKAGSAIQSADRDGLTALHCAASRGHTDCIDTLLTLCGASTDVIDSNGCTALHYAVTLGHADATALLLAHGADPNRQDRKGRSPAHCGCAKGQFETVKLIATRNANLWLRNARGDLPLHEAAASGRRELVSWLLNMRPSQVNAKNNDGRTPLHMAALNDNVDMCKILLDSGAAINPVLRTSKNIFMTPLDCALQKGHRSTAKYLQVHGGVPASKIGSPDITGSTATNTTQVNLQIKEDVSLWNDDTSSTTSEREHNQKTERKSTKKIQHRKKSSSKVKSKKKKVKSIESESGEDSEIPTATRVNAGTNTSANARERRASNHKVDYNNEITLINNGKTEINIHHSKEISVETDPSQLTPNKIRINSNEQISVPTSDFQEEVSTTLLNEPVARNQSGEKSQPIPKNNGEVVPQVVAPVESQEHNQETLSNPSQNNIATAAATAPTILLGQSTGTSDDTLDTVIDTYKQSQPSLMAESKISYLERSGTSEEYDEPQKIVVEASVHPEPVSVRKQTDAGEDEAKVNDGTVEVRPEEEKVQVELTPKEAITEVAEETKAESSSTVVPDEGTQKIESNTEVVAKEETSIMTAALIKASEDVKKTLIDNLQVETPVGDRKEIEEKKEEIKDNKVANVEQKEVKDNVEATVKEAIKSATKYTLQSQTVATDAARIEDQKDVNIAKTKDKNSKSVSKQKQSANKQLLSDDDMASNSSDYLSDSISTSTQQQHRSFKILSDKEAEALQTKNLKLKQLKGKKSKLPEKQSRSKSEEMKKTQKSLIKSDQQKKNLKSSRIPAPTFRMNLSKSERQLDRLKGTYTDGGDEGHLKVHKKVQSSLPNIHERFLKDRPDSNLSMPILPSMYHSDNEEPIDSEGSDSGSNSKQQQRKKVKKRSKCRRRESKSADGSDYESSNLIDSGFEPSPKSSRIPKWKNMSNRGVNMTSVTRSIQNNIRRYHLERKIFQHLLELKRNQIRAGQHNESVLVKRAIDQYNQSCSSTVGAGRYTKDDYTFKSFEKFLYESLRKLQKMDMEYLKGLPARAEHVNPLLCTQSTHRCMHATHAYTGVPCAAYLPKMDHHSIPKIGFGNTSTSTLCKPGTVSLLPDINQSKKSSASAVTLELSHGVDKQVISLPTDRLDQNKRYYVTFTVKGQDRASSDENNNNNNNNNSGDGGGGHIHAKSD